MFTPENIPLLRRLIKINIFLRRSTMNSTDFYNEFLKCVKDCVAEQIGEGGKVLINHIMKNNGRELDGLVILEKDSIISPTIYLNYYYQKYVQGCAVEEIAAQIMEFYRKHKDNIDFDPSVFLNYENVKDSIVYKVINYDKNKKLLEDIPHKKILDLAVVFYWLVKRGNDDNASVLIHNDNINRWGISQEELYETALINTPKLLESCIKPISMLLNEIIDRNAKKEERVCDDYSNDELALMFSSTDMFVLTNKAKFNGAACILYEKLLDRFSNAVDSDLYILPSSVHEVIILPKSSGYDKNMLQDMVREVNAEGVAADEVLSDNVYEYRRADGKIIL